MQGAERRLVMVAGAVVHPAPGAVGIDFPAKLHYTGDTVVRKSPRNWVRFEAVTRTVLWMSEN